MESDEANSVTTGAGGSGTSARSNSVSCPSTSRTPLPSTDSTEAAVGLPPLAPSTNSSEGRKKNKIVGSGGKLRSEVWNHFKKNEKDDKLCHCIYCGKTYSCDTKKNGTSTLKGHVDRCHENIKNKDKHQSTLRFKDSGSEGSSLTVWKFDAVKIRKALAFMIIVDELPFRFVERPGFKFFMSMCCPQFRVPSRYTIRRDCWQLYMEETEKLKQIFKGGTSRVCITTDTLTSVQKINYMCITVHYIDDDWKLVKRIINFCQCSSHKGEDIGRAIEKCLMDWGINKFLTVTVDNASSNDVAIAYLKKKLWAKKSILGGNYIHIRCLAHIINLVVVDGIKMVGASVQKIRAACRYVRQSPSRFEKFQECAEAEHIESKAFLRLDVPTRWNSTYLMLEVAVKYEKAFDRYEILDPSFRKELESPNKDGVGVGFPTENDWEAARRLQVFLYRFYIVTTRVSGQHYVTSNRFLQEICGIYCNLQKMLKSPDKAVVTMASKMQQKYCKYWGELEDLNMLVFIPLVLDPRHKLIFVSFCIEEMYNMEMGEKICDKVKIAMEELFNEYKRLHGSEQGQSSEPSDTTSTCVSTEVEVFDEDEMDRRFRMKRMRLGMVEMKTELEKYLAEPNEIVVDDSKFDILLWWKVNVGRYPILSMMARDVLAIPMSNVASEAAFSTGGRVLDDFRSSLTPKMAEALICTGDWLRNKHMASVVVEDIFEEEPPNLNDGESIVLDSEIGVHPFDPLS